MTEKLKALWYGFGEIFDVAPRVHLYKIDPRPDRVRDTEALFNDWALIGQDLRDAIEEARRGEIIKEKESISST